MVHWPSHHQSEAWEPSGPHHQVNHLQWLSSLILWSLSFLAPSATILAEPFLPGLLPQDPTWPLILISLLRRAPLLSHGQSVRCRLRSAAISRHFKDKVPIPQHGMPGTFHGGPVFFSNLFSCQHPTGFRHPSYRTTLFPSAASSPLAFVSFHKAVSALTTLFFLSPYKDLHDPSWTNSSHQSLWPSSPGTPPSTEWAALLISLPKHSQLLPISTES